MPFDPSQPFEVEKQAPNAPTGFDPSKPFEVEQAPYRASMADVGISGGEFENVQPVELPLFGKPNSFARGVSEGLTGTVKFATSTPGVAMAPAIMVPGVGAALGTAMSAGALWQAAQDLTEAFQKKSPQAAGRGVFMGALGALGALGSVKGITEAAKDLPRSTAAVVESTTRPVISPEPMFTSDRWVGPSQQLPAPPVWTGYDQPIGPEPRVGAPISRQLTAPSIKLPEKSGVYGPELRTAVPMSRQLVGPATRLPERAAELGPVAPEARPELRAELARELGPEVAAPAEPRAGDRIVLPIEPETAKAARRVWSKPIDIEAQVEGADALRQLASLTEETKTPGEPYQMPTVNVDLRQLERMMQRNTVSKVESWADEVLQKKMKETGANPFLDPEFMAAAAAKGAILFKRGVTKVSEWNDEMRKQFGRGMEDLLPKIYQQSKEYWEGREREAPTPVVPQTVTPVTPSEPSKTYRVYHGTPSEVSGEFVANKADDFPLRGVSVSTEKPVAERYAKDVDLRKGSAEAPTVHHLDLDGRVVDVSELRDQWEQTGKPWEDSFTDEITQFARSKGYDAVDLTSAGMGDHGELFVINPKALKQVRAPERLNTLNTTTPEVSAAKEPAPAPARAPEPAPAQATPAPAPAALQPRAIAIKNASVDAQRAARGLPPLMEPARKSDSALWDASMARIEADPSLPDRLVRELTDQPRPMTDEENVIVAHRLVELTNDLSRAREEGMGAADAGDLAKAAEMEARAGEISDALTAIEQAVGREETEGGPGAGTLMGRALRARQLLMREDFTYGGLERMKREANGFQPLTEPQKQEVTATAHEFKQAEDRLQAHLRKQAQAEASKELAKLKRESQAVREEAARKRILKRIADYEARIQAGDYSQVKRTPVSDPETTRLRFALEKVKKRWYEGLVNDKLARRTPMQKVVGGALESLNAMRAILTSADLSALLRQGKFIVLGHPVRASRSVPAMVKSMFSEETAFAVNRAIEASPNYPLMRASKLYLAEHGVQLSKMEEAYMSRWASKVPGVGGVVRGSERAYTTFLNKLRADSFDAMAETLGRDGKLTPEQGRIIANFINVATGRGTIGLADQAAVGMNTFFFAPRYVASRFQMLLGQPLYYGLLSGKAPFTGKGAGAARALVAREYGQILAGAGVVYTLGRLAGADIETDPRSSDFGKMRWGNTRIDPLAGVNQVTVLLSRVASGETKSIRSGKIRPIRPTEDRRLRYGSDTTSDVIARFVRLKLAPAPGMVLDVASGTDAVGNPVTPGSVLKNATVPISIQDIATQMQNEGWPRALIFSVLSIFGETVQNFDENAPKR